MAKVAKQVLAMYHVATNDEMQVLDELRERAGLIWQHWGCWTNPGTAIRCQACGVSRREIGRAADDFGLGCKLGLR